MKELLDELEAALGDVHGLEVVDAVISLARSLVKKVRSENTNDVEVYMSAEEYASLQNDRTKLIRLQEELESKDINKIPVSEDTKMTDQKSEVPPQTEARELWVRQKEDGNWVVFGPGVWLENENAVSKFVHVIEYSAYEKLQAELAEAIAPILGVPGVPVSDNAAIIYLIREYRNELIDKDRNLKNCRANFDRAGKMYEKLQDENTRLKRIIAKELCENDDLGSEFTYVNVLKDQLAIAMLFADKLAGLRIPNPDYIDTREGYYIFKKGLMK